MPISLTSEGIYSRMNLLHPVFHSHASLSGSRVDLERILPTDLGDVDPDELLELLSEAPRFRERIAPVAVQLGNELIRGKNWTEMMIKAYRAFGRSFTQITLAIRQSMRNTFREKGMVPFMSLTLDPDALHRIIDMDYETGDNTYGKMMELFRSGILSPCVTVPWNILLPLVQSDDEVRLLVRIGFQFYLQILKRYQKFFKSVHKEAPSVIPFWLPEAAFSQRVLQIVYEEMTAMAKEEKIASPHLVLLLDNVQAKAVDNDTLMKSWNAVKIYPDKDEVASVIFRDRAFSEWVAYSNPSVKKLLDRTIAKVDSDLNSMKVDYCWSHFENLKALGFTTKSAGNFEQKIIKLTELQYMSVSPDVFVRRKLTGRFGRAPHEPQEVEIKDHTACSDWHDTNPSLGRWEGTLDSTAEYKLVDENRPYTRITRDGKRPEAGCQCWKLAWNRVRDDVASAVKGDFDKLGGGMMKVLADLVPNKDKKIVKRNVLNFLTNFSLVHWREHFVQQEMDEADLNVLDIVTDNLFEGCKSEPSEEEAIIAGVAAQAIYFAFDASRSDGTSWENLDQPAMYENVALLTLGLCNAVQIYKWQGNEAGAKALLDLLKSEVFDFATAYKRYKLMDMGVTEAEWKDAIKSEVEESKENLVSRAARRVAARHMRALGFKKEFAKEDEAITTNTGHHWRTDVNNSNFRWENTHFCGLSEE